MLRKTTRKSQGKEAFAKAKALKNMKPVVLKNLPNSICAIGVRDGKRYNACIVSSVMQVSKATSSLPPMVAISLNKGNYSSECI